MEFGLLKEEGLTAMKSLEGKLFSPPLLALPFSEGYFTLDADACIV